MNDEERTLADIIIADQLSTINWLRTELVRVKVLLERERQMRSDEKEINTRTIQWQAEEIKRLGEE